MTTKASTSKSSSLWSPVSIFWSKATYQHVASEFHPFHKHDLNVLVHLFTTSLGVWGAIQLANSFGYLNAVYAYAALIGLTTPLFSTAALHTIFCYACLLVPAPASWVIAMPEVLRTLAIESMQLEEESYTLQPWHVCVLAIAAGYGLQDLSHYIFQEPTYQASYMGAGKPWMLLVHSIWLQPLVIDSVLMRWCFLPNVVTRNRNVVTTVASRQAVQDLRVWINQNVPSTRETTHVWPHQQSGTTAATTALENDSAILAGFRKVFAAKHFDVKPVQGMNEIYVTAVGAKREINSDAVFYTPHTDGPYWFLPGASLYRVLVGVTPNTMVRTRFNLQHDTVGHQIVDMYSVLGFDYNRELHWIDHVPGQVNTERRSLLKLHFVVYPKGWHWYGNLVMRLNTNYNTWARGNFLRTLRPAGMYEYVLAWWIWLTTWFNAVWEEHFGWSNLVYIGAAYAFSRLVAHKAADANSVVAELPLFLILTSYRHYVVYMTTFAFRQPAVAHGYLMRDAKLYKTISMMHLGQRLLPLVDLRQDWPGVMLAVVGFSITILATARLGMDRTYFGAELGFCKPKWIDGFPYGTIPHPMIVGQLFAYSCIIAWFYERLSVENLAVIGTHMAFYTAHMVQEMLTSSY